MNKAKAIVARARERSQHLQRLAQGDQRADCGEITTLPRGRLRARASTRWPRRCGEASSGQRHPPLYPASSTSDSIIRLRVPRPSPVFVDGRHGRTQPDWHAHHQQVRRGRRPSPGPTVRRPVWRSCQSPRRQRGLGQETRRGTAGSPAPRLEVLSLRLVNPLPPIRFVSMNARLLSLAEDHRPRNVDGRLRGLDHPLAVYAEMTSRVSATRVNCGRNRATSCPAWRASSAHPGDAPDAVRIPPCSSAPSSRLSTTARIASHRRRRSPQQDRHADRRAVRGDEGAGAGR